MKFGPFYSAENSVGILIATGNVGNFLSFRADEVNTYLSRDAGLTWFEIAKGSNIYEVGDHGGLIVMTDDQKATDTLRYSWDEGATWELLKFSDVPIQVTNIIIEPTNTGQHFVLYGEKLSEFGYQKIAMIVGIDFTSLHQRVCQGDDTPDTDASDYETWSPNGSTTANCLLGK